MFILEMRIYRIEIRNSHEYYSILSVEMQRLPSLLLFHPSSMMKQYKRLWYVSN